MLWTIIILSTTALLCIIGARIWAAILLLKDKTKSLKDKTKSRFEKNKNKIQILRFCGIGLIIVALILFAIDRNL